MAKLAIKSDNQNQIMLFPPSLDELIPSNHVVRIVSAVIDRLDISGRLNNAVKDSRYVILSNTEDITFDEAMKASGLGSNTNDYFSPDYAVIVERAGL